MKRFLSFLVLILLLSCSGGSGVGTTSPTDPSISNVAAVPASGKAGTTNFNFVFSLDYSSTQGLSTLNYTYEGTTLSGDATGCTSAFTQCVGIGINGTLSSTVGTLTIPVWVTDTAGNKSNTVNISFSQT